MRRWFAVLVLGFAGACGTEPVPMGIATVSGRVFSASSAPITGVPVTISCPGGEQAVLTTDGVGSYSANLLAPAKPGTQLTCRFVVGSASQPRIQADVALWFSALMLHPIQEVDLRERTP